MERLIEIVNYLMKQVYTQNDNSCSERDLVDSLVQLGYSPEEINVAFKLLYSFPYSVKAGNEMRKDETLDLQEGFRIFSAEEQKKLSVACQGEIIRLMSNSLLNLSELEMILMEVARMETGEIGLKELGNIIHKVIMDQERLMMILPPRLLEGNPTFFLN
jgi:uncharacterized protein Smg (DUF494 family)